MEKNKDIEKIMEKYKEKLEKMNITQLLAEWDKVTKDLREG